mmetsp:Transcript_37774/g.107908  ORF Transcript_37774/g.107908 Transcript_37774/m.107908 type:complete len:416 (-) Transcript_37774:754-2001(-)
MVPRHSETVKWFAWAALIAFSSMRCIAWALFSSSSSSASEAVPRAPAWLASLAGSSRRSRRSMRSISWCLAAARSSLHTACSDCMACSLRACSTLSPLTSSSSVACSADRLLRLASTRPTCSLTEAWSCHTREMLSAAASRSRCSSARHSECPLQASRCSSICPILPCRACSSLAISSVVSARLAESSRTRLPSRPCSAAALATSASTRARVGPCASHAARRLLTWSSLARMQEGSWQPPSPEEVPRRPSRHLSRSIASAWPGSAAERSSSVLPCAPWVAARSLTSWACLSAAAPSMPSRQSRRSISGSWWPPHSLAAAWRPAPGAGRPRGPRARPTSDSTSASRCSSWEPSGSRPCSWSRRSRASRSSAPRRSAVSPTIDCSRVPSRSRSNDSWPWSRALSSAIRCSMSSSKLL